MSDAAILRPRRRRAGATPRPPGRRSWRRPRRSSPALGYDRAALRDIAAAAGADVALIKRYFGGKEGLFTEALKASFRPDR